jgi:hypothetical protein
LRTLTNVLGGHNGPGGIRTSDGKYEQRTKQIVKNVCKVVKLKKTDLSPVLTAQVAA